MLGIFLIIKMQTKLQQHHLIPHQDDLNNNLKKELTAISIGKLKGSCISDGNIQQCSQHQQHFDDSLLSSPYHHHDLAIPPLCMCLKLSVHIPTYIVLIFSKQHYLLIPEKK